MSDYPYVWRWRAKHGDRYGERCAVWARGRMNSIGVEFRDGFRTVTSAYAVRRAAVGPDRDAGATGATMARDARRGAGPGPRQRLVPT